MVEQEEKAALGRVAPHGLDAGRPAPGRSDLRPGQHLGEDTAHRGGIEPGRQVVGRSLPVVLPGDRRPCGQLAAAESCDLLRPVRRHQLAPEVTTALAPVGELDGDLAPRRKRQKIFNPQPEQLLERGRVTAQADVVVRVDDAAEEGHHQRSARLHVLIEIARRRLADQVEVGRQHDLVRGQVRGRVREIGGHVGVEEVAVVGTDLVKLAELARRLGGELQRPPGLPVEQDGDLGVDPAAANGVQLAEVGAQRLHLLPGAGMLGRAMRNHR